MTLTSIITAYDPEWPQRYEHERQKLTPIFGASLIEIHHVGSTAIPQLSAKPEIDILVVVSEITQPDEWTADLKIHGYQRGRDFSPVHLFYKRDVNGSRTHKIHVCNWRDPKTEEMLIFRDYLRKDRGVREQYQILKLELERKNTEGMTEYLEAKALFIQDAIAKANSE